MDLTPLFKKACGADRDAPRRLIQLVATLLSFSQESGVRCSAAMPEFLLGQAPFIYRGMASVMFTPPEMGLLSARGTSPSYST